MNFRQVHLDFHTSGKIPDVGTEFSKEQFQSMLKKGHINSITVFSKCHHGFAYHPSRANEMHPELKFDLLKAQIDAAHEIGVKTPVYLSAGIDEKMALRHPEWLIRRKDEKTTWAESFSVPGFHLHCFNTPYLDYLIEQVREVVKNYDADGIFMDITNVQPCYCGYCRRQLTEEGKEINDENIQELAERVYANYLNRVREAIDEFKPGLSVFHNGGHIRRGRRDLVYANSHIEIESLPTGEWGYDHFPLSVAYARTLGLEVVGQTGKFHTWWGEFGGYKHVNALKYESAIILANGAKISIGDQLHPNGKMDEETYRLIGETYKDVEIKEKWCNNVTAVADIALLSHEAVSNRLKNITGSIGQSTKSNQRDSGASRILVEGKYLFNVIDEEETFDKYKVIILPDVIRIDSVLKEKLNKYLSHGGKILATGESGLDYENNEFSFDFGVKYVGSSESVPNYLRPHIKLRNCGDAAYVMYSECCRVERTSGTELGIVENSYFNRTPEHFCSHQHAPSSGEYGGCGISVGNDGAYIAWKIFNEYAINGSLIAKETVCAVLDLLLGENKTLKTNLPAQGTTTVMRRENQYVNHLVYGAPVKRGESICVIEDLIPVYNISVEIKVKEKIKSVYLVPSMEQLEFSESGGYVKYNVPEVNCHQMVVLEY